MKSKNSDWCIEVFSEETEWLIDEVQVPGLLAQEVREILALPEEEDIRGIYRLEGEALDRIAARAGYRPVTGVSCFLSYEGDGTLH